MSLNFLFTRNIYIFLISIEKFLEDSFTSIERVALGTAMFYRMDRFKVNNLVFTLLYFYMFTCLHAYM
jgi:hypothetical protein